ncbi:hypothetical protein D3248_12905 [Leucobacter zeae]|nr:hypothetical protein [Leucobacter zeae]
MNGTSTPGAGAAAETPDDDATRAVVRAAPSDDGIDDATRVVDRPSPRVEGADGPLDDATRAVARPVPGDGDTRAVVRDAAEPTGGAVAEDATRAVPRPAADPDATEVVVARARRTPQADDPGAATGTRRPAGAVGTPAPPVAEPADRRGLPQEMFKPPLDPRRRARRSPFPQEEHTLPRRGVRPGMPVVSGARSEHPLRPKGELDPASPLARIGPPPGPESGALAAADRSSLRSTEKLNRRYAMTAIGGGAAVVLVVSAGLACIAWAAFG